jgi:hypothetical protein
MNTEEFLEHQKRIMIDAINETTNKSATEGLRDYFAAAALQGLISAAGDLDGIVNYSETVIAENAYALADAMLKERDK